ncbi:hypothetical protein V5S77_07660 [Corynebacterium accolens]
MARFRIRVLVPRIAKQVVWVVAEPVAEPVAVVEAMVVPVEMATHRSFSLV